MKLVRPSKLTSFRMCGFIAQLVEHRTDLRGGHGFESCRSPDFFQASSFQLLKLENLQRSLSLTLIYNRSSDMSYFTYTSQRPRTDDSGGSGGGSQGSLA